MTIPGSYLALIHSDRVSQKTREALLDRAEPDAVDYAPQTMDTRAYATLRAVLARVLPQDRVDVAQRVDQGLADGDTDGWRFALLPSDVEAFRAMLAELSDFAASDPAAQDDTLSAVQAGDRGPALKLWFEDLRGIATMIYVSHPSTFARMGYGGIAYAGDHPPERQGFIALEAGAREAWEPVADSAVNERGAA